MSLEGIKDYQKTLPIVEVYTAVQGEGSRVGMPTVVIRTTGCTHRCYFGEGGWCDSWYTSIHPEKGKYCFQDIVDIYKQNPQIKEMMITGGSPTMHPNLLEELTKFAHENNIFTTIETEGSHFVETTHPINLLSISPKFSNSIPVVGINTPGGKVVDERFLKTHNRYRLNYDAIIQSIEYHDDFQLKPVIDKELKIVPEVQEFLKELARRLADRSDVDLDYPEVRYFHTIKEKVYAMPAGDTREELTKSYGPVMNFCMQEGWNFTGRPHIIAFDTQREV